MSEEDLEQVECPRCGGLQGLRQRCGTCNQTGYILQKREPGHHTLSEARSGRVKEPPRYGLDGQIGPKTDDPLWSGTDKG